MICLVNLDNFFIVVYTDFHRDVVSLLDWLYVAARRAGSSIVHTRAARAIESAHVYTHHNMRVDIERGCCHAAGHMHAIDTYLDLLRDYYSADRP